MTNPLDISTEEYRIYQYSEGRTFRIDDPAELHVITDERGATHRVIDKGGMTHRPERGWLGISWKPRAGAPAFVA
jgi:hypothetical protein